MSAELRERLCVAAPFAGPGGRRGRRYVFYERFNPENAVRVDEIARTYAGREVRPSPPPSLGAPRRRRGAQVELWIELSRKYGPEAVERAAVTKKRRRPLTHVSAARR
jgi:hypothetical protein